LEEVIVASMGDIAQPKHAEIIQLFARLGAIIYAGEVKKYKDVAKQYKNIDTMPDDTPVGYMAQKYVRLYTHGGEWIEITKLSLNRHMAYRENDIIVGYLESESTYTKFKLRRPIQVIKNEMKKYAETKKVQPTLGHHKTTIRTTVVDTRLIEKGIVCATKNKYELIKILGALSVDISRLAPVDIRIKKFCELIKAELIAREEHERAIDSKYKYLYGWWDELPIIV
jgi:hypothetical protein